ncbi:MAG: hypothetical protein JW881_14045 [Spirochaetales bacterium]|nr:hypothetical protein [Spirochaetales bacterium]
MKEIEKLDKRLTTIINKLKNGMIIDEIIKQLNDSNPIEFTAASNENVFEKFSEKAGIYLFEIKNSSKKKTIKDWFEELWNTTDIKNFQHSPAIIKKRIADKKEKEWIELYLGKSKNVYKRILEHYNLEADKKTFGLKLRARGVKLKKQKFRVKWFYFGDIEEYITISTIIESCVRNKLKPITGRQ